MDDLMSDQPARPLTAVERRVGRLLAERQDIGDLMSGLLGSDDGVVRTVVAMSLDPEARDAVLRLIQDVQALGDAGLLAAEPAPPADAVCHAATAAISVTVAVPLVQPRARELARQLAEGLVRGETTLVFPPGARVTRHWPAEPPTAGSLVR